mmetsp:Transcript_26391/g.66568  ORF Transcript_26391/g.66568 Transcript_26391/m.66568 type:complete len:286 (+) Transcript_26391:3529-4386(+)
MHLVHQARFFFRHAHEVHRKQGGHRRDAPDRVGAGRAGEAPFAQRLEPEQDLHLLLPEGLQFVEFVEHDPLPHEHLQQREQEVLCPLDAQQLGALLVRAQQAHAAKLAHGQREKLRILQAVLARFLLGPDAALRGLQQHGGLGNVLVVPDDQPLVRHGLVPLPDDPLLHAGRLRHFCLRCRGGGCGGESRKSRSTGDTFCAATERLLKLRLVDDHFRAILPRAPHLQYPLQLLLHDLLSTLAFRACHPRELRQFFPAAPEWSQRPVPFPRIAAARRGLPSAAAQR